MLEDVKKNLSSRIDKELIDRLLEHYQKIKQNFWLNRDEECLEKVGKFVEIATRSLEHITLGAWTPFEKDLPILTTLQRFEQLPKNRFPESIRLLIPRILYSLYTFRSKRGGAHIKGINPNHIDATYVIFSCDWVLSELLRLYHSDDVSVIQELIDSIVDRKFPLIEEFGSDLKILNPDMSVKNKIIAVLYKSYPNFVPTGSLKKWIKTRSKTHIPTVLKNLDENSFVYRDRMRNKLTRKGIKYVEEELSTELWKV